MKRCPHCGVAYPDEEILCRDDAATLIGPPTPAIASVAAPELPPEQIVDVSAVDGGRHVLPDGAIENPAETPTGSRVLVAIVGGCVVAMVALVVFAVLSEDPPRRPVAGTPAAEPVIETPDPHDDDDAHGPHNLRGSSVGPASVVPSSSGRGGGTADPTERPPGDAVDAPRPATLRPGNRRRAKALNRTGFRAYKTGKYTKAERYYKRSVRSDPTYALAWYNRGCMEARRGKVRAALKSLANFKALDPAVDLRTRVRDDPDFDRVRHDKVFRTKLSIIANR